MAMRRQQLAAGAEQRHGTVPPGVLERLTANCLRRHRRHRCDEVKRRSLSEGRKRLPLCPARMGSRAGAPRAGAPRAGVVGGVGVALGRVTPWGGPWDRGALAHRARR